MAYRRIDDVAASDVALPGRLFDAIEPDQLGLDGPAWIKTADHRLGWWSEAVARERHAPSSSGEGPLDLQLFPPSMCTAFRGQDRIAMTTGRPYAVEEISPDGTVWYDKLKIPLLSDSGRVVGTFGAAIEVDVDGNEVLESAREAHDYHRRLLEWAGVSGEIHRAPEWLRRLHRIVDARFRERLAVADVAALVGVSPEHATRFFRRYYGCSLSQYWHALRSTWARDQILTTSATLSSIAYRAGYADQSHFTRFFKREFGITPSRLRRSDSF